MKVIKLFLLQHSFIKDFKTSTLQKCFVKLTNNSLTKHLANSFITVVSNFFTCCAIYTHPNCIQKIQQTHVENALFNEKRTFSRCL